MRSRREDLLANVRRVTRRHPQDLHRRARHRPSGRGLPPGPEARGAARRTCRRRCSSATSSPARAAIRTCCACCRPSSCKEAQVDLLAAALRSDRLNGHLVSMKRFIDLADLDAQHVRDLARARRAARARTRTAGARRQGARPAVPEPVAAHAGLVPGRHGAARRQLASSSRPAGHVAARDALGAVMDGDAAEHVREGIPVLASYCDAIGIRAFAEGANLDARSRRDRLPGRWRRWSTSR